MVLTLAWLSTAIVAPAALARRALHQGHVAFQRRNFAGARPHLERAARYEPLREEAVCLIAEASLHSSKPADALYALNTLLLEQDQLGKPRSPRVRLLRGIAGCMLGRPSAARRELAAIPKNLASVDELLAATQACILTGDTTGSHQLLEALDAHPLGEGPVAAAWRSAVPPSIFNWARCKNPGTPFLRSGSVPRPMSQPAAEFLRKLIGSWRRSLLPLSSASHHFSPTPHASQPGGSQPSPFCSETGILRNN